MTRTFELKPAVWAVLLVLLATWSSPVPAAAFTPPLAVSLPFAAKFLRHRLPSGTPTSGSNNWGSLPTRSSFISRGFRQHSLYMAPPLTVADVRFLARQSDNNKYYEGESEDQEGEEDEDEDEDEDLPLEFFQKTTPARTAIVSPFADGGGVPAAPPQAPPGRETPPPA